MMKSRVRLAWLITFALGFGVAGCDKQQKKDEAQAEQPKQKAEKEKKADKAKKGAKEKKPAHSSDIPGTPNQLGWDDDIPKVNFEITSPKDGATVEKADAKPLKVEFNVENYRIGRTIGQHVHFVLDNKPYQAHYTDGEAETFENLEPGTHTLRAFPSRHYHLSLKKNRPFDTVVFHVGEKSEDFTFDPSKPYLTYSRPKGTYPAGAAGKVMLDFYVSNTELGEDAKVVYAVDGEKRGTLTEWKPVLLDIGPGEHKVNLKLVDGEGNLIENGGYNDTTRTITVKSE